MNDKMKNVLEYKGYHTKVEYSAEDNILYGKIEGIRDLVNFRCETAPEAEAKFHEAVDDYLAFCADLETEPEKPYKGVFNVRISPELHKEAAVAADKKGLSLNALVNEALKIYIADNGAKYHITVNWPDEKRYKDAGVFNIRRVTQYASIRS